MAAKPALVYHPGYNIEAMGLEKLHAFDSKKYGRIFDAIRQEDPSGQHHDWIETDREILPEELLTIHSQEYLESLKKSSNVANIIEVGAVGLLPGALVDSVLLTPMRLAARGTMLACEAALERGFAVNLGAGYHHASATSCSGFCVYADLSIAIRRLLDAGRIQRPMIVDLDAHMGNGHERDFLDDRRVYIFDVYNKEIFPKDETAASRIDTAIPLRCGMRGMEYMQLLKESFPPLLDQVRPDFVLYNAGSDILEGDPLGLLSVSADKIADRDHFVVSECRARKLPVAMTLSGGYTTDSWQVMTRSLIRIASSWEESSK